MKTLSLILLLFGLVGLSGCKRASTPPAQTNSATQPSELQPTGGATTVAEVRYFRGSIGSTLGLQMKLNREGEKLSGDYYYQKIGTKIELRGTVDKDSNLTLEEFDASGKQTGVFKGIWKDNEDGLISLAGNWSKPNSDKMVAFSLHQEPIHFSSAAEINPKAIKETNKRLNYEINAQYPQVTGSTDRRFDKFNQEARKLVTAKVSMFRKEMAEQAKEEEEQSPSTEAATSGSDLGIGYTVNQANEDLISVQFDIAVYYQGAAHPNSHSQVLNYDVKSEKVLKLADLFKPGAKYLQAISSYSIQDLKKQSRAKGADSMLEDEWIGRGAGAEAGNYESWTITRKGLGINFDSYQVAPYAAGPQYVLVPYSVLKELIKPEGVIGRFVQ